MPSHSTGDNQESQLQAHKPKIIAPRPGRDLPARRQMRDQGTIPPALVRLAGNVRAKARTAQQMWAWEAEAKYDIKMNWYLYDKRLRAGSRWACASKRLSAGGNI